jgi:drug/metabolite transporter (DMT)-like permease
LLAATSSIFAIVMAASLLGEKPNVWQYVGMLVIAGGSYVFLANQVIAGSVVGVGLLLLAEVAFAFSGALVRKISAVYKADVSLPISLIGCAVGAIVMIPIALSVDGFKDVSWHWETILWVVTVGLIFAFAGLMWNSLLDKIRLVEASVISNTMLIQVAAFSIIFLGEHLATNNLIGGGLVMAGALITDAQLIWPQLVRVRQTSTT